MKSSFDDPNDLEADLTFNPTTDSIIDSIVESVADSADSFSPLNSSADIAEEWDDPTFHQTSTNTDDPWSQDNYHREEAPPVKGATDSSDENVLSLVPFIEAEHLKPPAGVPTGVSVIDKFLLWQGLPQGDLSLFQGLPGTGATSLWIQTLRQVHSENKWAAWVNSETQIFPAHLQSQGINLKRLLVLKEPEEKEQLFWVLQELITSSLFEVIGCNLKEMFLKNHQLQKLKRLCRLHKVALVLINPQPLKFVQPLFSLSILFQRDFVTVQRALHRPTPFQISGSMIHANFVHQFKNTSRKLLG